MHERGCRVGRGRTRHGKNRWGLAALLASIAACAAPMSAVAQLFRPGTVAIENARIVVGDGTILERATIIIRGDRIEAVGVDIPVPERAARIDAAGKTVTPGLIDVIGAIGNTSAAGSDASQLAADAFDRYNDESIRSALANGVTTLFLPARGDRGVTGVGAVVRLSASPGDTYGEIMVGEAALCIDLGSGDNATLRLQTFDAVRKRFKDAKAYRESRETYEDELAEYEKKVKERAAAQKPAEGAAGSPAGAPGGGAGAPPAGGSPPSGPPGGGGGGVDEFNGPDDLTGSVTELDVIEDPALQDPGRGPRPGGPPGGGSGGPGGGPGGQAGDGAAKPDELTKPQEPKRNFDAEMILKAVDRQLPVRIVAHRSADILNALSLAKEFNLRVEIEGATQSGAVTDAIKEAKVTILLDDAAGSRSNANGDARMIDEAIRALDADGVAFALGSGRNAGDAGRFLLFRAQTAASACEIDPIRLVTKQAASALGLSDRIGTVERGREADIVLWSGDPLDPGSRVESVYVKGAIAYLAGGVAEGKGESE